MDVFNLLIWGGALLTLIGLAGIIWCIVLVARARRAGLEAEAFHERMKSVVALNMGALFLSMLGLIAVVMGLMLR
ncbi:MAG: hypothetical protein Q4F71_02055 [Paracoccus sp. (in: a-proteobacteria)]|nr:hypothetical protein [Paracoccus sp. (in: a-proteobacteria)]